MAALSPALSRYPDRRSSLVYGLGAGDAAVAPGSSFATSPRPSTTSRHTPGTFSSPMPNDPAFSRLFRAVTTPASARAPADLEPCTWPVAERRRLFEPEAAAPAAEAVGVLGVPSPLPLDDIVEAPSRILAQGSPSPTSTRHLMSALRGRNCSFSPGSFGSVDEHSQNMVFALLPSPLRVRRSLPQCEEERILQHNSPRPFDGSSLFRVPSPEPSERATSPICDGLIAGLESSHASSEAQEPVPIAERHYLEDGKSCEGIIIGPGSSRTSSDGEEPRPIPEIGETFRHATAPGSCAVPAVAPRAEEELGRREARLRELEEQFRCAQDEALREQKASLTLREQNLAERERSFQALLALSATRFEARAEQPAAASARASTDNDRAASLVANTFMKIVFFIARVVMAFPILLIIPLYLWLLPRDMRGQTSVQCNVSNTLDPEEAQEDVRSGRVIFGSLSAVVAYGFSFLVM